IPVSVNESIPDKKRKVFALLLDSLLALRRENKEVIYSSMVKDTMKRKKPSFNEEYYGYRTFSELLEDAQKEGLLELDKHKASGMYVVTRFGLEMKSGTTPTPAAAGNGGRGGPPPGPRQPERSRAPTPERIERPAAGERDRRPAAEPPPARPPPARPAPPPPKREEPEPPEYIDRPLGRELVEDVDVLEDEGANEVPTYRPGGAPVPAKPPVKPDSGRKPSGRSGGGQKAPAKPAAKKPAGRSGQRRGSGSGSGRTGAG